MSGCFFNGVQLVEARISILITPIVGSKYSFVEVSYNDEIVKFQNALRCSHFGSVLLEGNKEIFDKFFLECVTNSVCSVSYSPVPFKPYMDKSFRRYHIFYTDVYGHVVTLGYKLQLVTGSNAHHLIKRVDSV